MTYANRAGTGRISGNFAECGSCSIGGENSICESNLPARQKADSRQVEASELADYIS